MTAAVHQRNYGRASAMKTDRFRSNKYAGFHPDTQPSGTSWNSVRWVRPTPGSVSRHSNISSQFRSTPTTSGTMTTYARQDYNRQSYDKNNYAPPWRANFSRESRQSEKTTDIRKSDIPLLRPSVFHKPPPDRGTTSRRGSFATLQENKSFSLVPDAASTLRTKADQTLSSGIANRIEEDFRYAGTSRRGSFVGDSDRSYPRSRTSSISLTENSDRQNLSSRSRLENDTSSIYPSLSKSWPPTRSLSENSRPPPSRNTSTGSIGGNYGSTYYLSGRRRDSTGRPPPGAYTGLSTQTRKDLQKSLSTNYTSRSGLRQQNNIGAYSSSVERVSTNGSRLVDSWTAPRQFLSKKKAESDGYDSSSSDTTQSFKNPGRSKMYKKRSFSRKNQSNQYLSNSMIGVSPGSSSTGVLKSKNQSSSDDESHTKGLFDYRMNQRRKRLLRSKALVKSEEFGIPAAELMPTGFQVEKVYLQNSLASQNMRPQDIMTSSLPAVLSFYNTGNLEPCNSMEKASLSINIPVSEKAQNSSSNALIETAKEGIVSPVPAENTSISKINTKHDLEVDISESSDTLVPGTEEARKYPNPYAIKYSAQEIKEEYTQNTPDYLPTAADVTLCPEIVFGGFSNNFISSKPDGVSEKAAVQEKRGATITTAAVSSSEVRSPGRTPEAKSLENKDQTRKDTVDFQVTQQKQLKENQLELAAVSVLEKSRAPVLPAVQGIDTAPRFAGAKRIVLLHSGPNETTVFEKSSSLSDQAEASEKKSESPFIVSGSPKTKIPTTYFSAEIRPKSLNLEGEKLNNVFSSGPKSPEENKADHALPSVEKEVTELLTLGEELRASQQSLSISSRSDSGFRTPEVSNLPEPSQAVVLSYFTPPPKSDKDWQEVVDRSGDTTPTLQRKGSLESVASTFMTAQSEMLGSLTFAFTAVPQPFRGSLENISKTYAHVEPGIEQLSQDVLVPLQRTASMASNDSWASAASGRSSALQNAAKKGIIQKLRHT